MAVSASTFKYIKMRLFSKNKKPAQTEKFKKTFRSKPVSPFSSPRTHKRPIYTHQKIIPMRGSSHFKHGSMIPWYVINIPRNQKWSNSLLAFIL